MDPEPPLPRSAISFLIIAIFSFSATLASASVAAVESRCVVHVLEESVRVARPASSKEFESVDAVKFFAVVSKLESMPYLRQRPLDEYIQIFEEGGHLYLNGDGTIGYGINKDKLLISVFNNSKTKGRGAEAVLDAVKNGATSLVCVGTPRSADILRSLQFPCS